MFKYWIYKFGQFCVTRLPLRISYKLSIFLSDIHYYFSFRDKRAVKNNLKVVLNSDKDIDILAREVFRNFGKYLVDFFRMSRDVDRDFIEQRVRIENIESIQKIKALGKGAIILTAHIGNWELGGVILSRLGYSSLAIALPHKERPVNNLFDRQRELQGITVVPVQMAIRKCLEALSNNQFIAVLADRNFTGSGEVLEFFGKRTLFPKGAAIFSLKTGAPIIPTFLIRESDGKFILSVQEPIYPPLVTDKEDSQQAVISLMRRYIDVIEVQIRKYPTQWLMFRKFWIE